MDKNIYSPPEAPLLAEEHKVQPLATRRSRLGASFIDTLIMALVGVPLMYFTGGIESVMRGNQPGLAYSLAMFAVTTTLYFVINFRPLIARGQTIGKQLVGIRIVDAAGNVPSLKTLAKRYAVFMLVPQLPFIGPMLSTINLLFILGEQRRCLHDIVADTRVVKVLEMRR